MPELKPLSDAIFEPLNKAYKVGGFGLAILSLGAFLMLFAFFWSAEGALRYVTLFTGLFMIMLPAAFFFFKEVRPLIRVQDSINHNKDLLDTVQRTAIEMTELASDLQSLAFKHAHQISSFIQDVRPQLRLIPLLGKIADSEVMSRTEQLSSAIVDGTLKAKDIIKDIETALIQSNPAGLTKYLSDLKELRVDVEQILRNNNA